MARAGVSVARYLRDVGQGYQIKGVMDYQHVRELVRVNGDLGRLGLRVAGRNDDLHGARLADALLQNVVIAELVEEHQKRLGESIRVRITTQRLDDRLEGVVIS